MHIFGLAFILSLTTTIQVLRVSADYILFLRVVIFSVGEILVLLANLVVYHAVLVHDKFLRANAHINPAAMTRSMLKVKAG